MSLNPSSKLFLWGTTGLVVEPTDAFKQAGWVVSTSTSRQRPPAQFANWLEQQTNSWIEALMSLFLGMGDDGALDFNGGAVLGISPVSGVYTLTRGIYPTNMTVRAGYQVMANGWPIIGNGTLTIENTGVIQYNGSAGGNGRVAVGPGLGGAAGNKSGLLGYGGAGGNGAAATGTASVAGDPENPSLGGTGGGGGAGGIYGPASGGAVIAPGEQFGGTHAMRVFPRCLTGVVFGFSSGTPTTQMLLGGGGGGGGGATGSSEGGGGGGGAGILVVAFRSMNVLGTCFQANGGNGGNGVGDAAGANGGGGGGGGGVVSLFCVENQNSGVALSTNCSASGGTGGLGNVGGNGGANGSNGSAGNIYIYQP